MATYRPTMAAVLTVVRDTNISVSPAVGGAAGAASAAAGAFGSGQLASLLTTGDDASGLLTFPVRVRHARLEVNDHNHADTLNCTMEWADIGVDPRLITNATVQFYLGDAYDVEGSSIANNEAFAIRPETLRFVGIATRIGRSGKTEDGFSVEMDFHDYTALFLATKPFPTKGIPDLDQTLEDAWARICEHTGVTVGDGEIVSTVSQLSDRLELEGSLKGADLVIGRAVAARFRKLGKVPIKQGCDAWAVWQTCVGMCGLISFIDGDRCVVTTATDYYTLENPPRLIWGRNISSWNEHRKVELVKKGVGITSFNPLTGTTIEALYPPPGDQRVMHRHLTAKKANNPDAVRQASDYVYYAVPSITDPDVALKVAERAFEERSRQEMEGTLRTWEMRVPVASTLVTENDVTREEEADHFDLMKLRSGDIIRVELADDLWELRGNGTFDSYQKRFEALLAKGYAEEAADIIARGLDDLTKVDGTFHVKKVTATCEVDADGGNFEVEISYVNRIKVVE